MVAPKLFLKEPRFVMGVAALEQVPATSLPEVAFVGRSNVGKSSLINALTGRKALARASNTPGRTQQLNFFSIADTLMLVDLPGYGYAKASKKEVAGWQALMRGYLRGRAQLKRVMVLIDSRHGVKPSDLEMMEMLDIHAVSYQLVLTKRDKISAAAAEAVMESVKTQTETRPARHPEILTTSSVSKEGIEMVQWALDALTKE